MKPISPIVARKMTRTDASQCFGAELESTAFFSMKALTDPVGGDDSGKLHGDAVLLPGTRTSGSPPTTTSSPSPPPTSSSVGYACERRTSHSNSSLDRSACASFDGNTLVP